ncbi:right-handed parallel beta-helix repeat-containing protein, partial [Candidatus Margulisiibacteriota bacterium]
ETSVCTLDAQTADRLILVSNAVQLTIEGITLTNGYRTTVGGAGVYLTAGSTLNLEDAIFISNKGSSTLIPGGAVYADGSYVYANDSYFYDSYGFGGVSYGGTWEANNCIFLSNQGGTTIHSGGVATGRDTSVPPSWTATNCIFKDNWAYSKGGVFRQVNFTADHCTFEANFANQLLVVGGGVAYSGTAYVSDCTFIGNYADDGSIGDGGVFYEMTVVATNCANGSFGRSFKGYPFQIRPD